MNELDRDAMKRLAVLLMQVCVELGVKVKEAARISEFVGKTERTVREWRQDYDGQFSEYKKGKHRRSSILDDEDARMLAVRYVRENACKKSQPNLTASMFCKWVNFELLPSMTLDPSLPRGTGLMVSEEFNGFLRLSDVEFNSIPSDREKPARKEAR